MIPQIKQGSIRVEAILGVVADEYFILYVTTQQKYPEAHVVCGGLLTLIAVYADHNFPEDDEREEHDEATTIELPGGWDIAVSTSRYTIEIMGIRTSVSDRLTSIPFELVPKNMK